MHIAADCCLQRDRVPFIFSSTTSQNIYCTNSVQTVQSATGLNLQELHRISCYMFSCTTAYKLSSCCLLKCSPARCFTFTYISMYSFSHVVRPDLSNQLYCPKAQCPLFSALRITTICYYFYVLLTVHFSNI